VEPVGDPLGYALAFEEGKARVADQAATLRETRDRSATVVSTAAIIVGLGTSLALSDGRGERLTAWGIAAAVIAGLAFAAVVAAVVMVWRPGMMGVFARDSGVLVGSYVEGEPPATLPEIHRELALHLGNHAAYNDERISKRLDWFARSLWAFLIEIGALLVMILDVAQ
jgi:hypothetical protein